MTIEGPTNITFTEDVGSRFLSYGWNVTRVSDADDFRMLARAYETFLHTNDRPTLIIIESHIGYGAPHKQDTAAAHGEPLGPKEVRLTKEFYGWDPDAEFYVPDGVQKHFQDQLGHRGINAHGLWNELFSTYRKQYPDLADQIDCMQRTELPEQWEAALPTFAADAKRDGHARLFRQGAQCHRRESTMGARGRGRSRSIDENAFEFRICRRLSTARRRRLLSGSQLPFRSSGNTRCARSPMDWLYPNSAPFAASFFIFTDYCRGAVRLTALKELPVIYIWTHDSVSLGEDGPTHQPVEHLASRRAMPGMIVIRPADANEVVEAWRVIMQIKNRPVSLVLTRQALPTIDRTRYAPANGLAKGAYVLLDAANLKPDVILMATGSEVSLCVAAHEQLLSEGINARVISIPHGMFDAQSLEYRNSVLPPEVTARVAVEEASMFGWERYVGSHGTVVGIHSFGLSAPIEVIQRHFGFTPEHVVTAARQQVARQG